MPDSLFPVVHQAEKNRFYITLNDTEAVLEYRLFKQASASVDPDSVDFTYTYVPQEFRGKGLAEKLVHEGLRWARGKELTIRASCWYVAKFLR